MPTFSLPVNSWAITFSKPRFYLLYGLPRLFLGHAATDVIDAPSATVASDVAVLSNSTDGSDPANAAAMRSLVDIMAHFWRSSRFIFPPLPCKIDTSLPYHLRQSFIALTPRIVRLRNLLGVLKNQRDCKVVWNTWTGNRSRASVLRNQQLGIRAPLMDHFVESCGD